MRRIFACLCAGLLVAGCATQVGGPVGGPVASVLVGSPPPLPAVGDIAVYRVINAYNGEAQGDIQYRVDKVDAGYVMVAVTTTSPYAGLPHTEVYTTEGNWLRHPVVNHDRPVDYDFAPPYPAYPFPLDIGKSWSMRVNATNPVTGRVNSVRVDGQVAGAERVSTPAGTFDTIKIVRYVYAGDWEGFLRETHITEIDWYAPASGRVVRAERNSRWLDLSRASGRGGIFGGSDGWFRGDWSVSELISHTRAAQGDK